MMDNLLWFSGGVLAGIILGGGITGLGVYMGLRDFQKQFKKGE